MSNIKIAIERVDSEIKEREIWKIQLDRTSRLVKKKKRALKTVAITHELIHSCARLVQERTYAELTEIVSKCLTAVFKTPYTFGLEFIKRQGRTDALFYYERNGIRIDPLRCGGVTDVASLALRLSVLLLQRKRKVLVGDEPFRCLDKVGRKKIPMLLKILEEELGFQIVMVTHADELKEEGKVFNLNEREV